MKNTRLAIGGIFMAPRKPEHEGGARMAAKQELERRLLKELSACEAGVWEALVQGDMQADEAALADNFLGVYSDGFSEKTDHVQQLANGAVMQSYRLGRMRVMSLGPRHALISYRADFLRTGHTKAEAMYITSVWKRASQGWVNIFSQDTLAID